VPEQIEVQLARLDEQVKALRQVVEGAKFVAEAANRNAALLKERALNADREQDSRRNLLYGVAGAFAATAFGVLAHLAGLV
jgi:hypothetical protein